MAFLRGMEPGESWSATALREHLGISKSGWERLVPKLKSETTELGQLMAELNVVYEVTGTGQSQKAHVRKF